MTVDQPSSPFNFFPNSYFPMKPGFEWASKLSLIAITFSAAMWIFLSSESVRLITGPPVSSSRPEKNELAPQ